jgi:hypothetical protein
MVKTTRFWGPLSKDLCSPEVDLLASVVESAEKVVFGLPAFQGFSASASDRFCQLSKCRQSCGLWNGNTCAGEDNDLVVSQGVQERVGEINS